MSKWIKIVGMVTAVAVVGVLVLGVVAFAQRPPDGPDGPGWGMERSPFGMRGMRGPGGFDRLAAQGGQVMAEALGMSIEDFRAALAEGQTPQEIAAAQGVDWSDVEAALQSAAQERLQQAVEDGKLTQEQADAILERLAEHDFDGGFMGGPAGFKGHKFSPRGRFGGPGAERGNALAEVLGMSEEDFRAAMEEGRKQVLEDIVESQGMTMSDVANALYDRAVERLESAVSDGKLTQEQADRILEQVTERRDACVNDGDCFPQPPRPPMPFGNFGR